jgi:catalase
MAKSVEFETAVGAGGDTHQHVPKDASHGGEGHLTTNQGIRIADNQNSRRSGIRGPRARRLRAAGKDFSFRPSAHSRAHCAYLRVGGPRVFEPDDSLSELTAADLFQRKGERIPVFTAIFHGGRGRGFGQYAARCARICGEVLYQTRELGPRQQ